MAVILTSVTPSQRYTPFAGLDEQSRAASGIARAEDVRRASGTWPATAVGDTRVISFNHALDPDYGYIVMDCFAKFYGVSELRMEATGNFQIQTTPGHADNEIIETQMINDASRMDSAGSGVGGIGAGPWNTFRPGDAADTGSITFRLAEPKPSMLIFPFAKTSYPPSITVNFGEQVANQGAYNYYFYLRLLQYDISQGYNYVIQSPQLTR